ncbi:hypothetical protein RJ639_026600 [Escallonia herrerae]|uniref:Protein kinase domain-containing protein n=1 Tax=Escallonia herrerae TaxID=1293975 RepID=A0AA88UYD1_9ASTE|nr:hypothetical protein RJ639_026600 [Escallonia herrerae]
MGLFAPFQLLCMCLGLFLVASDAVAPNEVYALSSFKEAIYEDPLLVLSNWNSIEADPCDWSVLDLGVNQLSGPIPPEIGNLSSITKINLQSNGLTGRLPLELGNLKYLEELRLDRNKLQGTVPGSNGSDFTSNIHGMFVSSSNPTGFCRSSQLKVADFSYNFFVGDIPNCLDYLPRFSFQGNCLEDKGPKQRTPPQCGTTTPAKSHPGVDTKHRPVEDRSKHQATSKPSWLLALEIVTGVMVGSLFLVALLTAVQKCKSKSSIIIPWKKSASEKDHMAIYVDSGMLKDVVRFSRQELEVACEDFSNIIGSSSDSLVYKGNMKGGPEVAVIALCIKEEHWTGYLEFYFQTELISRGISKWLNHRTLVLVADGEGCQLSWTRRMKIIIGIAKGLKYLHTEIEPPFTISELNSSAVYLTEDFSPKLVDFESWKTILSRSEKNSGTIGSEGAICILQNSLDRRHLDVQGNIYGFGVLLLEIISGRPPYCKDKGSLVDWAKDYLELPEVMSYVVDPELKHFRYDDLKAICEVVALCIHPKPIKQLAMQEICAILESRIDTSVSSELQASSLAWAELALSS